MTLLDEQKKSYVEAVRPAMKWIAENCHPHTKIIIESDSAELVEGIIAERTDEFIKD